MQGDSQIPVKGNFVGE